jgi:hypothetical protein
MRRGLTTAPQIAVADGALGFWNALGGAFSHSLGQRRIFTAKEL